MESRESDNVKEDEKIMLSKDVWLFVSDKDIRIFQNKKLLLEINTYPCNASEWKFKRY